MTNSENELFGGIILDENDGNTQDKKIDPLNVMESMDTGDKKKRIDDKISQFKEKETENKRAADISEIIDENHNEVAKPEDDEFKNALIDFNNKNYTSAFNTFKKLAEEKNTEAIFMLGNMYNKGLGTAADIDRAKYWLKNAADKGHVEAGFDYGLMQLNNSSRTAKETADGFYYLALAADGGYDNAAKKYVDLVSNGIGGKNEVKKAIQYCNMLAAKSDDSFDAQKYTDMAKTIKSNKNIVNGKSAGNGFAQPYKVSIGDIIFTILGISGMIMLVISVFIGAGILTIEDAQPNTFSNISLGFYNWLISLGITADELFMELTVPFIGVTLIKLADEQMVPFKFYAKVRHIEWVIIALLLLYIGLGISFKDMGDYILLLVLVKIGGLIVGKVLVFVLDFF